LQTSAIRYRVVDFLRQHTPFHAMDEEDLLALVAGGRVRFHEVDEYVYWQGHPPGPHIFVIQQGTVSLWEEDDEGGRLHDVRGPGDLLGIDGLLGAPHHRQSAKAGSDVVLYALPAADFEGLLAKYPAAARYLAAHSTVSVSYEASDLKPRAPRVFVHEVIRGRPLVTGVPSEAVRAVVRRMRLAEVVAAAIVGEGGRLAGVLSANRLLSLVADASLDPAAPVEAVMDRAPLTAAPDATAAACVLAMAEARADVLAITDGGAAGGRVRGLVTSRDLEPLFGDHPLHLLREAASAAGAEALRAQNVRARAFLLDQLAAPAAVDWLATLALRFDARVVERLVALAGGQPPGACWFFFGASGRGESMTALSPQLGLVFTAGGDWPAVYRHLFDSLPSCGYLPRAPLGDADVAFRCASLGEWQDRFRGWVRDPLGTQIYQARPLFDLRPILGDASLVASIESVGRQEAAAHPEFVRVLAHDCLANLPPLAFFRDAVVDESGERREVFQLERSALRPIVDVGRVFGIAAGRAFGTSTLDRLAAARVLLPAHDAVFREAADTLRLLLYHQARSGLRRQDGGTEIAPAGLGGYDRQLLRSGFRSILRLLELTEQHWDGGA
jgi:CBS domain-containing protein